VTMNRNEKWICTNPNCRNERIASEPSLERPRCTCGFPMRRPYEKPILQKFVPCRDRSTTID
jgi:hypothetical protein